MFPKDAHFICRNCRKWFAVQASDFSAIKKTGNLHCPTCEQIFPTEITKEFFKHYMRLSKMTDALAADGFELKEVYAKEIPGLAELVPQRYTIIGLDFACTKCGQISGGNIEDSGPNNTDLVQCFDCGTKPRPIIFTEFFNELNHVNRRQFEFGVLFQLDLFSHKGLDPYNFVKNHNEPDKE